MFSRISSQLSPVNKEIYKLYLFKFLSQTFTSNASIVRSKHQIIDKNNLIKNALPSNISLQVIGNGSDGNPSALFLVSDDKLYLFNCSEGLQRLVPEYKLKLSKVDHIFLTSNKWHNISGISGLALNRFDSCVRELKLHGIDCQKTSEFCTHFDHKLKNIDYTFYDYKLNKEPFIDDLVSITSVPIMTDSLTTIAYICKLHPKKGLFLIDKCFHMKIPRNLVPKLQSRQSVVLENGLTVNPEEVHTPDEPEKTFIVIECPSIPFIDSVISNNKLIEHIRNSPNIECVVHFTPNHVMKDANYQSFINRFCPQVYHLVINRQNPSFSLHSLHRFQTQLNLLDPKVFPLISEQIDLNKNIMTDGNENIIKCQTGLKYTLRPSEGKGINFDSLEAIDFSRLKENAIKDRSGNEREGFEQSLQQLRSKQQILDKASNSSKSANYPEVVFLGTASASPLAIRNVTSILVKTSAKSSILLDCGENTFGQILRYYGPSQMSDVFDKLKAIFISHPHSDHHMGLIQVIKRHYHYTNRPVVIFIPPLVIRWLNNYNREFENLSKQYHMIPTTSMEQKNILQVLKQLRLKQLKAIPVIHSQSSFGILIKTEDNQTIVYSGDAEPSDRLIEEGKDCDLLIHEATVEDSLINFARDHFHSTVSEAIEVGRKMNANFTILTHFSQRYVKIPLIPDNQINNNKIGIAYDFMRVTIPELDRLPLLLPTLKCLYAKNLDHLRVREVIYKRRFSNLQ